MQCTLRGVKVEPLREPNSSSGVSDMKSLGSSPGLGKLVPRVDRSHRAIFFQHSLLDHNPWNWQI